MVKRVGVLLEPREFPFLFLAGVEEGLCIFEVLRERVEMLP
jgi:hypothetical protein